MSRTRTSSTGVTLLTYARIVCTHQIQRTKSPRKSKMRKARILFLLTPLPRLLSACVRDRPGQDRLQKVFLEERLDRYRPPPYPGAQEWPGESGPAQHPIRHHESGILNESFCSDRNSSSRILPPSHRLGLRNNVGWMFQKRAKYEGMEQN